MRILCRTLQVANKIQSVGKDGFLPIKKVRADTDNGTCDFNLLTKHERDML